MTKEIDRFNAKTDSGISYTIVVYQEYIQCNTLSNTSEMVEGTKRFVTSSGKAVNAIDSDTCQIVGTGEIVHRL